MGAVSVEARDQRGSTERGQPQDSVAVYDYYIEPESRSGRSTSSTVTRIPSAQAALVSHSGGVCDDTSPAISPYESRDGGRPPISSRQHNAGHTSAEEVDHCEPSIVTRRLLVACPSAEDDSRVGATRVAERHLAEIASIGLSGRSVSSVASRRLIHQAHSTSSVDCSESSSNDHRQLHSNAQAEVVASSAPPADAQSPPVALLSAASPAHRAAIAAGPQSASAMTSSPRPPASSVATKALRTHLIHRVLQAWPGASFAALPHELQVRGRQLQHLSTLGISPSTYIARRKDSDWPPAKIPNTSDAQSSAHAFELKGWALHAPSIAYKEALQSGEAELPIAEQRLQVQAWRTEHQRACEHCAASLHPDCYMSELLRCFTHGFRVPWSSLPAPHPRMHNTPTVTKFRRWVTSELARMREGNAIATASEEQVRRSSPLIVIVREEDCIRGRRILNDPRFDITDDDSFERMTAKCDELREPRPKLRLVVDLSATPSRKSSVNGHIRKLPLALSSPADLIAFMEPGAQGIVIDLERAYWQLPIAQEDRPYFGFWFEDQHYWYTTAPFGASCSVWMQSLVSAEALRYLRTRGLQAAVYIDDFGIVVPPHMDAPAHKQLATDLLRALGLGINLTKVTGPDWLFRFLGLWLNTHSMQVTIDPGKAQAAWLQVTRILSRIHSRTPVTIVDRIHARTLAGRLSWMAILTQGGRHRLAALWAVATGEALSWPDTATRDLQWWSSCLQRWYEKEIPAIGGGRLLTQQSLQSAYLVVSDASDTGAGYWHGPLAAPGPLTAVAFAFTPEQRTSSSTMREAIAVDHFLRTQQEHYRGQLIICCTDNMALAHLLSSGRAKHMARTIRTMLDTADSAKSSILGLFIPRELNDVADALSRVAPVDCHQTITGTIDTVLAAAAPLRTEA